MLIGSRQRLNTIPDALKLSTNDVPINPLSSVKSLGVLIDGNLTWQTRIDKLTKKIASGIGAIKRIRPFVPPATLLYIYSALIQPHFDYWNLVWGNCGETLSDYKSFRTAPLACELSLVMILMPKVLYDNWVEKICIPSVKFRKPLWYLNL